MTNCDIQIWHTLAEVKIFLFLFVIKLKAWGHNHSMSIFRPFFIFSRSDGQFVAIFPSNFPMTPRSASIHAWALNPARKKKKKFPNFIPSKSLHFFAKSQAFGFAPSPLRHS